MPAEEKPTEKKPAEKKSTEKKSTEKKSSEKKSAEIGGESALRDTNVITDGGRLVKMEVDYSTTCNEKIPAAQKMAKDGSVQEAVDILMVLEKQTRTVSIPVPPFFFIFSCGLLMLLLPLWVSNTLNHFVGLSAVCFALCNFSFPSCSSFLYSTFHLENIIM